MPKNKCRICNSQNLIKFLDLGFHPPSDAFLTELYQPEIYYPLDVYYCKKCGLVQLGYVVDARLLFNETYPYTTGTNKAGIEHFNEFAQEVTERFSLLSTDFVVDIGSNDGTLLKAFKDYSRCKVLGVDPCPHIESKVTHTIAFWSEPLAHFILHNHGKAKIITTTNTFAHVDDLHAFMRGIDILLADDGIFIIEMPYWTSQVEGLGYDQIYHEHLSYFNMEPLGMLCAKYNMNIFAAEPQDIHGGSMRYFIKRDKNWDFMGISPHHDYLFKFANRVKRHRKDLVWLLTNLKRTSNKIAGVCASAKGNTLLNYCKIGPETLDYISEVSPLKIGKFTPGMHIPVVSDEQLVKDQPDYVLMLACNWKGSIPKILREKGYKGKMIFPFPEIEVRE